MEGIVGVIRDLVRIVTDFETAAGMFSIPLDLQFQFPNFDIIFVR